MFDQKNRFVIRDCQQKPTFSSFLPGIAGPKGVPAWTYYNNRGQGVCSFGAKDRDHAMMEFCPAHVAYQNNARTGFRTFAKVNGEYRELFTHHVDMHIGTAELMICQEDQGLKAEVTYYGLPGERVAGLVRMLTVTNTTQEPMDLELLDGMSAVVCYGIDQDTVKQFTQLAKAWMQSQFGSEGATYFGLRASMADTACVTQVEGVNFAYALDEQGTVLRPLVQPSLVFGQSTGLECAQTFQQVGLKELCEKKQVTTNQFPCCFMPCVKTLAPGQSVQVYTVYGQAARSAEVTKLVETVDGVDWFLRHYEQAVALGEEISKEVQVHTAHPVFDAYCRQTYVDNLLRGGTPMFFQADGRKVPFYLYSRKHGDPEREYNFFSVGDEFYAQGNGNFRDVNQNRRCDVLFHPDLEDTNIRMFYELLQTDGYNPLVIKASTLRLDEAVRRELAAQLPQHCQEEANAILEGDFTPGKLSMAVQTWGLEDGDSFVSKCVVSAGSDPNADFGEGYWCDHWTYNLDLIESYLAVYPDRKGELLFGDANYRWYASHAYVLPREERYVMSDNGLRQYKSVDEEKAQTSDGKWLVDGNGRQVTGTLAEKLVLMSTIKSATLDSQGMGVEMEGGKPGWYDALNGLPGLFGSSMSETCELERMLRFTIQVLEEQGGEISLMIELVKLLDGVYAAAQEKDAWKRWNQMSLVREGYRASMVPTVSGQREVVSVHDVADKLKVFLAMVEEGISKAEVYGNGLIPTYFRFEATGVDEKGLPTGLEVYPLPYFLEGPVRRLKTQMSREEKEALAQKVKSSDLYDQKLEMYKVNASLEDVTFEVGRCRAFTAGWLENESIWLHMEYKYLLELLKSGLYTQFFEDFHKAGVPFMNPEVYGRSPLENCSFLASSALPNQEDHGRGFVARLSGSTAEFLHIWQLMFFSAAPFALEDGELVAQFAPAIPNYLMPENGQLRTTFMGEIPVTYHCQGLKELVPGGYQVSKWVLTQRDGVQVTCEAHKLKGQLAQQLRQGEFVALDVYVV